MNFIDTHAHLDGEEFKEDLPQVVERARVAGVSKVFVPAIDLASSKAVLQLSRDYAGFAFPMAGLHPEEVHADWREQLAAIRRVIDESWATLPASDTGEAARKTPFIAVGEVGLDFYWSREFEHEQLEAFEEQMHWSMEYRLPLMIHCRKGQNEMLHMMRPYAKELPGGVFHCFTGNQKEAEDFLAFDRFVLGIGGVLTFKSSHLREDLPAVVPLDRIVLETDSPYMAPVPNRGKRNESAFVRLVLEQLAACYGVAPETVAAQTNANVQRVFGL